MTLSLSLNKLPKSNNKKTDVYLLKETIVGIVIMAVIEIIKFVLWGKPDDFPKIPKKNGGKNGK